MKQSKRLISERRIRAHIFKAYDELNPDNIPREISQQMFDLLDEILGDIIDGFVENESCPGGRLIPTQQVEIRFSNDFDCYDEQEENNDNSE